MVTRNLVILILLLALPQVINAQNEDIPNLIEYIKIKNPDLYRQIGASKLTDEERKNLNNLLNNIFLTGIEEGGKEKTSNLLVPKSKSPITPTSNSVKAYKTKIDDDDGDILKLDNGAIVEIAYGFLGYVGYRKDCVLFKSGSQWKIWIQGKKFYKCDLLKSPQYGSPIQVEKVYISEVKADGTILVMLDGSIYEVSDLYTIYTSLWLGMSDALILNGFQLINLDEGDEIIDVYRIK